MVIDFFLRVSRSFAKQGLANIAVAAIDPTLFSAGNLLGKVAVDIWKDYRLDKKQNQLHQDILTAAKLTFEEAKQAGIEAAKLATDDPELQGQIERLVTLIPASIRASLRRAEDPTGTTLPANYAVHDAEDLVKLFPVRLPRFKAGDTPVFLRGWRLVEQVGAGGFGEVWKVQSTRAGNLLGAVKLSHGLSETEQSLLNENDLLNRLLKEGELDGIVPLHDVWADGDPVPWLRYKYIAGGDLTALIHRWQGLAPASRYETAVDGRLQLAGTVGHFHNLTNAEGKPDPIVHRDLKPSNILCDKDKLLVADLGIGAISSRRSLGGDASRGMSQGAVLASYLRGSHTPLYASPQQKAGSRAIDPRDDVHALGVIAYQMITGQLDAAPGSDAEYDLRAKGASDPLIELIKQCTSREPTRRPPNANAMSAELHELRTPKVAVPREVDPIELELVPTKPIPVAIKPETAAQRVSRLENEAQALQAEARAALQLHDFELAATTLADFRPELLAFRDEAFFRQTATDRDRLRFLHKAVHDRLGDNQFKDPKLPGLIAEFVALKENDPEMNELAQKYPIRDRLRFLHKEVHDRLGAKQFKAPMLPGLIAEFVALKKNDPEMNELAQKYPVPKIGQTITNKLGMKFAWVPPGDSWLGGGSGKPVKRMFTIEAGFWAGVYPVTQAEWLAVVGGANPSRFKGDRRPVEAVSADLIDQSFLIELNKKCRGDGYTYRLPTADEWEYLARGGPIRQEQRRFDFYFAKSKTDLTPNPTCDLDSSMANFDGNYPAGRGSKGRYLEKTTEVGLYLPNPLGIYDLIGNVCEWTSTVEGSGRVNRGGSWISHSMRCAASFRHSTTPDDSNSFTGFRLLAVPSA